MMGGLVARSVKTKQRQLAAAVLRARKQRGFTIIEVLIVLAVTGLLFVSAAVLIAGRQNQTEFNQAIRQVQIQIQQAINDVATGFYPNTNSFQCIAGAGGPILTAGSAEQGANEGCIFVGKAMQFGISGTSPQQVATITVAGLQKTAGGAEVSTLAQAQPRAVAPSTTSASTPDITAVSRLAGGLTAVDMWYDNGAGRRAIGEVAFVNSLANYAGGAIVSGTQQVAVVPVDDNGVNSALDRSRPQGAEAINTSLAASPLNPSGGVFICFRSGGTNQSGLITIGDSARQLSVTLTIKNGLDCA